RGSAPPLPRGARRRDRRVGPRRRLQCPLRGSIPRGAGPGAARPRARGRANPSATVGSPARGAPARLPPGVPRLLLAQASAAGGGPRPRLRGPRGGRGLGRGPRVGSPRAGPPRAGGGGPAGSCAPRVLPARHAGDGGAGARARCGPYSLTSANGELGCPVGGREIRHAIWAFLSPP